MLNRMEATQEQKHEMIMIQLKALEARIEELYKLIKPKNNKEVIKGSVPKPFTQAGGAR